jgi:adenylate cyclase
MMTISSWQRLLAELKRRQVFRVAAVYGAAAFVLIQAVDIVFPRLALPDWTVTLVVALALFGLIPALALAWAFDATPHGVRRTEPAAAAELAAILAQSRARRWPAGIAALAGIALLAGGAWFTAGRGPAAAYDSIAVLPFVNLSADPENEYFGDGLAEELLNALAGIEGLKVAARTSAFAFKNSQADVRTIGDTLRVATVLEGSVRRSADRIRITAQLIDARTGYHLWSETYDRPLTDLFAVQDAITEEIVSALAVRLTGTARTEGLYRGGTTDVEAYDLYLLGRQKWATRQIPLLHEALAHFEQAIARDSSFALAWSGFADVIDAMAWRHVPGMRERVGEAKAAAVRAVILEPELAEGWASLGVLMFEFEYDFRFAELALKRAVALKPSYATAYLWLGDALRYAGKPQESLEAFESGARLDPLSPLGYAVSLTLLALDRWDDAREVTLRFRDVQFASQSHPAARLVSQAVRFGFTAGETATYAREWAALAGYAAADEAEVIGRAVFDASQRGAARALLQRMDAVGIQPRDLAELHLALGDTESAIALLLRAFDDGDPTLLQLGMDPTFDALRDDPRYQRIMDALRMPRE